MQRNEYKANRYFLQNFNSRHCWLELLQFWVLIHKIQRKFFNMYKFWVFSKFAREISNFLTYLECPHNVWMWKIEKKSLNLYFQPFLNSVMWTSIVLWAFKIMSDGVFPGKSWSQPVIKSIWQWNHFIICLDVMVFVSKPAWINKFSLFLNLSG